MSKLHERALELAASGLASGEPLVPFALSARGETFTYTTLVTERSDVAMQMGRLFVRQQARDCDEYVIVADAFVRVDGVRRDAILVERGTRDHHVAEVVAHLYEQARLTGVEPLEHRPSALADVDPASFAWGPVTPDFYNREHNEAAVVVNHVLDSPDAVARTIRFVRGRIAHHARYLPGGARFRIFIEDRGGDIDRAVRDELVAAFAPSPVALMSELEGTP